MFLKVDTPPSPLHTHKTLCEYYLVVAPVDIAEDHPATRDQTESLRRDENFKIQCDPFELILTLLLTRSAGSCLKVAGLWCGVLETAVGRADRLV